MTVRPTFMSHLAGLLTMTTAALSLAALPMDEEAQLLTDFTTATPNLGWIVVNDNVMGGRSDGGYGIRHGNLIFRGRTNTNGGGFSSLRTKRLDLDLSADGGIRLDALGDGRRYTLRLTTDARWRGREVAYWADFDTVDGQWRTIDVPFTNFVPRFRGYALAGPELDTSRIRGIGLMIYDKEDGPFELEVARIASYTPEPFSLSDYRWEKRVLVIGAPDDSHEHLAAQRQAVALTGHEFDDRDMVLVTLLEDGHSSAGGRALSPAEAATIRDSLGLQSGSFALRLIGKDGSVKLARDSATAMDDIYALIDTMPMRRREM